MNLYICLTPLQMLIANKLIELKQEPSDVLILTYNLNEKYEYYIDKINTNILVKDIFKIKLEESSFFTKSENFVNIWKWTRSREYNTIYFACLESIHIHFILEKIKFCHLYTFDDGSANIFPNSIYYTYTPSLKNKLMRFLLGIKWDLNLVKKMTEKHYTIYKSFQNVVNNTEFVNVFSYGFYTTGEKKILLFLGQPFKNPKESVELFNLLLIKYKNIYYFMHPREDSSFIERHISKEFLLSSSLIVEDYVSSLLKNGYNVHLFSVSSSAGFNMYDCEGVEVYFICYKKEKGIKEFFDFLSLNNLPVLYMEDENAL